MVGEIKEVEDTSQPHNRSRPGPCPGSRRHKGTTVNLTVSKGPPCCPCRPSTTRTAATRSGSWRARASRCRWTPGVLRRPRHGPAGSSPSPGSRSRPASRSSSGASSSDRRPLRTTARATVAAGAARARTARLGAHAPGRRRPGQGGAALRGRRGRRGGAGLRLQPARLGADRRATRRRTRRSWPAAPSGACPPYIHASLLVNLGSPTEATVERSAQTLAHALRAGRRDRRARAWCSTPVARSTRRTPSAALRQVREVLLPLLDAAAAAAGRGCWSSPARAAAGSLAARVEDLADYLDAVDGHPWLGRLLRHLPRLGGRARPGRARRDDRDAGRAGGDGRPGPAGAGARQRLQGRVRLAAGPAREHRRGHDRRGARSPSCSPIRPRRAYRSSWRRPSTGHAGHAADIATLARSSRRCAVVTSRRAHLTELG